ncbi:prepilin-type N-terminal cleavage/methylation domain-containing protein [Shewanella eurypsychrophilus]|uniref:Prepilin-type N-terminal cleavage/methylation domain-containing protein n=1 Tax=Shewanella eurypsychrophilus TaxID=2593656 RepID=A0ABX6VD21_9GAMM|nr:MULTISPECIES: prepilin-type N-terminal cleavage/methylation domain-containing protein [Shewanella]QFU23085.1 prepilin-type N-terminal cleavage/methylation domain-containing protein [Shewanella sp. YLB-09]QPG58368.1 prepilin-type N-terminal cleavage/methylation domain-containing protein [Shewanella eurypsychrophilus]
MKYVVSKGFTLIELVVVIIILGLLSVVALPKFINLGQDAHDSAAKSLFGAFSSGVKMYHSCWNASGASSQVDDLSCYGDGTLDSSNTGFPLSTTNGGDGNHLTGDKCKEIWQGLLEGDDYVLAPHNNAAFGGDTDIVYHYGNGSSLTGGSYCYYNYISDNRAIGSENWQLQYSPGSGQTIITRATLSVN